MLFVSVGCCLLRSHALIASVARWRLLLLRASVVACAVVVPGRCSRGRRRSRIVAPIPSVPSLSRRRLLVPAIPAVLLGRALRRVPLLLPILPRRAVEPGTRSAKAWRTTVSAISALRTHLRRLRRVPAVFKSEGSRE